MVQKNSIKPEILIICGPTASGKTALAVECAKLLSSEVISADSMNVYNGLNVGTAKPTKQEKKGIVHHMIDVVSPFDTFSVGDYKEQAEPILNRLINSGKIPIVCGGTGFYINSLIYDLSYGSTSGNLEVREYYKKIAEEKGFSFVHEILKNKDAKAAETIHPNDVKRVIRALEIFESGIKKSELNDKNEPIRPYKAYSYDIPRGELYCKIDLRVDKMIENGLVDEVKELTDKGLTIENQCMQGIGYKEILSYLSNGITLTEAIQKIKLNTRHYAKRQITFFKKLPELKYVKRYEDVVETAKNIVGELYD